ncbi:MFS transporter [Catellatospora sp. TT07R-123]|uniref:MFS transporter n=1 Tax=Catellatospora sp. TT07R-123 TaxID=2733863 RepID=UPI001B0FA1E0|nr:MFS transporter [Catellatospora sp. TT07R-123]GHJ43846.1 MFS transporter [Catellatospora sp. TT07R-123]
MLVPARTPAPHPDSRRIIAARALRTFGFGCTSVLLADRLAADGCTAAQIGALIAVACAGSVTGTVFMAACADRCGRRASLAVSALLMAAAGAVFATCHSYPLLLAAAFVGTVSPSTNDNTPFSGIEQAILAHTTPPGHHTRVFTWYNVSAQLAGALGGLAAAGLAATGGTRAGQYAFVLYTVLALAIGLLAACLSDQAEAPARRAGTRTAAQPVPSRVRTLAALFGLDAFAGGLVVQSLLAWWLHERYGIALSGLGLLFFAMNLAAALAQLAAPALAARRGLLPAMLWPHAASNLLLLAAAFAPTFPAAAALLVSRCALSKIDVPARQAFTAALVAPSQRTAAASLTSAARSIAVTTSPLAATALTLAPLAAAVTPLVTAAVLGLAYDALLLRSFGHDPSGRPAPATPPRRPRPHPHRPAHTTPDRVPH